MKKYYSKRHRIYDFGLPNVYNFFLTKVIQIYNSFWHRYQEEAFAYVSSTQLRVLFGGNYKKKINYLIDSGYIYQRSIGNTMYGDIYGFIPLVKTSGIKNVFIYQADNYYKQRNLTDNEKFLERSLTRTTFEPIDYPQLIEDLYHRKQSSSTFESYCDHFAWLRQELESLEHHPLLVVDAFGNRVHTTPTQTPKELRKYLLIDNQPTIEIDFSQSQPTILGQILYDKIGTNSFTNTLSDNDIYEFIQNNYDLESRDDAKIKYCQIIYGDLGMSKDFISLFPDIKQFIINAKTQPIAENPSSKIYSNLAFILTRKESEIMRAVWNKLEDNNIPLLTIHDSIIVKKSDYFVSSQIMSATLKEYLPNTQVSLSPTTT
jgi:hypothetical protein